MGNKYSANPLPRFLLACHEHPHRIVGCRYVRTGRHVRSGRIVGFSNKVLVLLHGKPGQNTLCWVSTCLSESAPGPDQGSKLSCEGPLNVFLGTPHAGSTPMRGGARTRVLSVSSPYQA